MFVHFFALRDAWFTAPSGVGCGVPTHFHAAGCQMLGDHPQISAITPPPTHRASPAVPG
jgi:hypothetical protein